MSKSVSLDNLNNESAEDQLVTEILNEINNNSKQLENNNQSLQESQQELNNQEQNQPELEPEQELEPEPEKESSESQLQMNVEKIISDPDIETFENNTSTTHSVDHKKQTLFNKLKSPLVVGLFVVLFSLPITNNLLLKMLPAKDFITNNSTIFASLLKFLLAAILYFALDQVW